MSDDYVREKLGAALDALAVSEAPIQSRLADAAMAMVSLGADDFAGAEERALFGETWRALTAQEPTGEEGAIAATTSRLDDEAAVALAGAIVRLHGCFFPWPEEGRVRAG